MNAALQNVVRPSDNYYDDILDYARRSIRGGSIKKFTSEEMAEHWCLYQAEKIPSEPRVYGAVIKQLQREGKICHVGYTKATNKQAHCRPISVWEVV